MFYKLVPFIDVPFKVRVCYRKKGYSYSMYGTMNLEPNKTYTTDGDTVLENSLRSFEVKRSYSKALEDALEKTGTPHRVAVCGGCGGNKKSIFYNPVEVFQ